jgi:MATE family multidrug resistance protein
VQDPAAHASVRGILRLALPLAASTGLGFFLHYVNRTVLSWHSPEALAASLPAGMLAWTFQGFFLLSCGYLGVFAAQHAAAGERREVGAMAWPMILLAGFAGLAALVLVPCRGLLAGIFGTEPEVERGLSELLGWYLAELPFLALSGGLSGMAGGLGRTRLVLLVTVIQAVVCIALNAWLVLGGLGLPALGITGAGLASLATAAFMAFTWLAWFLAPAQRRDFATWLERNADPARFRRFCRYALPRGATEILEMVGFVAFTAVVTRLGTEALAAANLAFNTYLVLLVPVIGFCGGLGIAVGQAMGAGRVDLARRAVRSAGLVLVPYLLLLCAAFWLIPELLLAPARSADGATWAAQLALAVPVLGVMGIAAVFDGLQWWWRSALQGAGDTRWPLVVLVVLAVAMLAVPAWIIAPNLPRGRDGLLISYGLFAVYVAAIAGVLWWRYARGPWPGMSVRS